MYNPNLALPEESKTELGQTLQTRFRQQLKIHIGDPEDGKTYYSI